MLTTEHEHDGYELLLDALSLKADAVKARELLVKSLCSLSGAEGANLLLGRKYLSPAPGDRVDANYGVHAHKSHWVCEAMPRYALGNPVLPFVPRLDSPVYVHSEVVGTVAWRESEYYLEFLSQMDTRCAAGLTLRGDDGTIVGGMNFGHPEPKGFSSEGLARLSGVSRQVARGLSDILEWERWQARRSTALQELLAGMSDVMIAVRCSPSGSVELLAASPAAEEALGLHERGGRSNPELSALLEMSKPCARPAAPRMVWAARDGTSFEVKAAAIPSVGESTVLVRLDPVATNLGWRRHHLRARARAAKLTAREIEICELLSRGLSHKEIAAELGLSYFTVTTHVRNLFSKLSAKSRVEALNAIEGLVAGEKRAPRR